MVPQLRGKVMQAEPETEPLRTYALYQSDVKLM